MSVIHIIHWIICY